MHIDLVYCVCGNPETDTCKPSPELYWSILSTKRFMPWIRHTYITVPDGFDESKSLVKSSKNLTFVLESTFVPKRFLPTFNSNVVESWLWRLPNLANNFVYMNDDMYIGRLTSPTDFFSENSHNSHNIHSIPILRHESGPTRHSSPTSTNTLINSSIPYVRMWVGAINKYNLNFTRIQHQALPQQVSIMKDLYNRYKHDIDTASKNKTRSGEHDFNLLRFSSSFAVMDGHSLLKVTHESTDYFCESNESKKIKHILKIRPMFFCINNNSAANIQVYDMLKAYYT